jgi:hypothetical protein
MATINDIQARIASAVAALDAAQYANAIRLADGALLLLATTPDTQFDGTDQIRFDRQGATMALNSVITRATSLMSSASPRTELVHYARG